MQQQRMQLLLEHHPPGVLTCHSCLQHTTQLIDQRWRFQTCPCLQLLIWAGICRSHHSTADDWPTVAAAAASTSQHSCQTRACTASTADHARPPCQALRCTMKQSHRVTTSFKLTRTTS
jgi:hypothetical protein